MDKHVEDTGVPKNDVQSLASTALSEESIILVEANEGGKGAINDAFGNLLPGLSISKPENCDSVSKPNQGMSIEEFHQSNLKKDLCVYTQSQAGQLPEGNGTAYYAPGTPVGNVLSVHGGWGDKIFTQDNDGNRVMQNKLLHVDAGVAYGESLLDGKQSIILDYPEHKVRGEMRQTGPDDYLGILYAHVPDWAPSTKGYAPLAVLGVHVDKK